MISVIVPVYNAEKYLNKCIDSIINQTYKDLEIILVDDGSTDMSSKICDYYSSSDNRIRVFHKKNGGVSSARNLGIKYATGDYISFVDADDYLHYMAYEILSNICIKHNCQASTINLIHFNYNSNYLDESINTENLEITFYNNDDILKNIYSYTFNSKFQNVITCGLYGIYKRVLFENLCFDENVHIGEDIQFLIYLNNKVNKVAHINQQLYYYRDDNVSAMRQNKISEKNFTYLSALKNIVAYLKGNNNDNYLNFEFRYIFDFFDLLFKSKQHNNHRLELEFKRYISDFKTNFITLIKNKYLSSDMVFVMICFMILPSKIFLKIYGICENKFVKKLDILLKEDNYYEE